MKKIDTGFKQAREQTDESLTVERGNTDQSFESYKGKAESRTDQSVTEKRLEIDGARKQRRSDVDSRSSVFGQKQKLFDERTLEDTAIKNERSNMDMAIKIERGQKDRLLNHLMHQERATTDKNLLGERDKADLESERAANLLYVEQAAHSTTKSALTTREEFVAIVSHDLRNPVGTILSSADVLLEDAVTLGLTAEAEEFVRMIKRNAESSLRLISDILDMERIAEGKLQLMPGRHNIETLVTETIQDFQIRAAEKNVSLLSRLSGQTLLATFDRDRILQVLANLVGNALKFTPRGGAITVSVLGDKNEIKVLVRDNGPGIPDSERVRIFERFAQIKNEDRCGLGLGLYISKTILESHHGKLSVESTAGKGSTFYFTLPKEPQTN